MASGGRSCEGDLETLEICRYGFPTSMHPRTLLHWFQTEAKLSRLNTPEHQSGPSVRSCHRISDSELSRNRRCYSYKLSLWTNILQLWTLTCSVQHDTAAFRRRWESWSKGRFYAVNAAITLYWCLTSFWVQMALYPALPSWCAIWNFDLGFGLINHIWWISEWAC